MLTGALKLFPLPRMTLALPVNVRLIAGLAPSWEKFLILSDPAEIPVPIMAIDLPEARFAVPVETPKYTSPAGVFR